MADALEGKITALSEAQARERRFTADVAHELRTPLTAIVNEASLLADHIDQMPAEARRPAELLVEDVKRLRDLVEDLMEISRLDAGTQPLRPEPVDLGALVETAIRARGWEERVRVDAGRLVLVTDPRRVERIVANLIGNALEHGGKDVAARVGRDSLRAFVEVSDRGPGIAREDLPHLFDRFYKADPARAGRGTGLGLAIALENARLLERRHRGLERDGSRCAVHAPVACYGTVTRRRGGCCGRPAGLTHRVVQGGRHEGPHRRSRARPRRLARLPRRQLQLGWRRDLRRPDSVAGGDDRRYERRDPDNDGSGDRDRFRH